MKLSFNKPRFFQQTPESHKEEISFLKQHVISNHDTGIRLWSDLKNVFQSHETLLEELSFLQQETSGSAEIFSNRLEGVRNAAINAKTALESLKTRTEQKPGLKTKKEKLESSEQITKQLDELIKTLNSMNPEDKNHARETTTNEVNEYLSAFKKGMLEFTG